MEKRKKKGKDLHTRTYAHEHIYIKLDEDGSLGNGS